MLAFLSNSINSFVRKLLESFEMVRIMASARVGYNATEMGDVVTMKGRSKFADEEKFGEARYIASKINSFMTLRSVTFVESRFC